MHKKKKRKTNHKYHICVSVSCCVQTKLFFTLELPRGIHPGISPGAKPGSHKQKLSQFPHFKQSVKKHGIDLKSHTIFIQQNCSGSLLTMFVVVFRHWRGSDGLLGVSVLGGPAPWQP